MRSPLLGLFEALPRIPLKGPYDALECPHEAGPLMGIMMPVRLFSFMEEGVLE